MSPGPEQEALLDALATEYAAVFAYGVVATFSNPERAGTVATATAAHRARRDATIDSLTAVSIDIPPPDAAYTLPFPVSDPVAAAQLAVAIESDAAVAWRSVIERAQSEHARGTGIDALTECSLRLADWRSILGIAPPTVAFPGQP